MVILCWSQATVIKEKRKKKSSPFVGTRYEGSGLFPYLWFPYISAFLGFLWGWSHCPLFIFPYLVPTVPYSKLCIIPWIVLCGFLALNHETPFSFFFFFFKILFIYSCEIQRERSRDIGRGRSSFPARSPMWSLIPDLGIMSWAKGRCSTNEPHRCPNHETSWMK